MASVRIICRADKVNNRGESPLFIRLTHQRKNKYVATKIMVDAEKDWDEKLQQVRKCFTNSQRTNQYLVSLYAQVHDLAIELNSNRLSWNELNINEIVYDPPSMDFFSFGQEMEEGLMANEQFRSAQRYRTVLKKLKLYCNGKSLEFADISVTFLKRYETYLRKLGNMKNTVHSNLKTIRSIYYEAIRQDVVSQEKNPFFKFKLKKEVTAKIRPNEDEIERLASLNLDSHLLSLQHARDAFMFSLYCAGIRVGDLLQLTPANIHDDILTYSMNKTSAPRVVKLVKQATDILQKYNMSQLREPIFPYLKKIDLTGGGSVALILSGCKISRFQLILSC